MSRAARVDQAANPEAPQAPPGFSYVEAYRFDPMKRIAIIKGGVRARLVKKLLTDLALPQEAGMAALSLNRSTVDKKVAKDEALPPDEGERVIGMASLVGQLEAMIEESGEPEGFDATAWLSRWLREPLPAFGGVAPIEFMDTIEGQRLVARALAQAESGAYA